MEQAESAKKVESEPADPSSAAFGSVHTDSFAQLLARLGISVAVTTYQAGKLILLRAGAGDGLLNTHFRNFKKPMGIAANGGRLAVGTATEILEFHNVPAVSPKLESTTPHDAVYMPRSSHVTGEIFIHEMAWDSAERLWFVNTRFSCLCVRSDRHSFEPRWRPPFITALAPEDRCHLNGLGLRDGEPRYVTALGKTNDPRGWRSNKRNGGILFDIVENGVITAGLSMPHSPRWHEERLWMLESGEGGIGVIEPRSGRYEPVAQLPGFTRGLDFFGRYAFVGLSQVRESAVFSGIPIVDRPAAERFCGVWVVDTLTGQVVAYVKFTDAVQEIFAVQVIPGTRWPEVIPVDDAIVSESFILSDEALEQVAASHRTGVSPRLQSLKPNQFQHTQSGASE